VLTFFIFASLRGQDCKKLENGKYKVKPKSKLYKDYFLIINNDDFTIIRENGEQAKGQIKWTDDCIFVLDYAEKIQVDTASFGYKIHRGWGQQCYELSERNNRTFRMTWTGNLHVQLYEGKLKKIRN
jgi:hypothetical protein